MSKTIQVITDGVVKTYEMSQVNFSVKSGIRGKKKHTVDDIKVEEIDTKSLLDQGYTIKQIYNKRHYEKQKLKKKQAMKEIMISNLE